MKTCYNILLLFPIIILFTACPYESTVPIDENNCPIKKELLGTWQEPNKDNGDIFQIGELDNFHYMIERSFSNKGLLPEKYIAHLSMINDTAFLNLTLVDNFNEPKNKDKKDGYLLYKLNYKAACLTLWEVSDKIKEKFSNSKTLKNFISKNMHKSYFFNKTELFLINKYQIEKTARLNAELSKGLEIQKIRTKETRALNLILIISLMFLLSIIFFLWYYFRSKQITYKLLTEKKEISAMLDGQEAERTRIALDLHDRLGSMLSTVKLYFSSLEDQLEHLRRENKEQYSKASHLLDEACDEVRKISHDLSSGSISRFGLESALNDLKETISKTNKLKVQVFAFGMDTRLSPELEIALFRIIQELLSNVVKHAAANIVTIQLTRRDDHLNLIVEDDGKGFDEKKEEKNAGIGIGNIRSRLSAFNGDFKIDSKPGKGTSVIIDIPLR